MAQPIIPRSRRRSAILNSEPLAGPFDGFGATQGRVAAQQAERNAQIAAQQEADRKTQEQEQRRIDQQAEDAAIAERQVLEKSGAQVEYKTETLPSGRSLVRGI